MSKMRYPLLQFLWFILLTILISACGRLTTDTTPPPPGESIQTPTTDKEKVIFGEAKVDEIQILILESFPVQIQVMARGTLPDACTEIDKVRINRSGNRFLVTITTRRLAELNCIQVLAPFEEVFSLDVMNLKAGVYEVSVNGATDTFELTVDNTIQAEPTPTTVQVGSIQGQVWHDLCAFSLDESGDPLDPSAGCIQTGDNEYRANGVFDVDEPGIVGVEVTLGEGTCPGSEIGVELTQANGKFTFSNLPPGDYCLSIDPTDKPNDEILNPGEWTSPVTDETTSQYNLTLAPGETLENQDFGWDFQFLPEPASEADCTNQASFVDDVTFPDGSDLGPNEPFTKTWRLRNDGSCTWTQDYAAVFVDGDQMNGPDEVRFAIMVASGEEVDISIDLTSPDKIGDYRGNWLLRNAAGDTFGLGRTGEDPFWVQIIVEDMISQPELGSPTWQDTFATALNWGYYENDRVKFERKNEKLLMTAKNADFFDAWVLSPYGSMVDFYLEMIATTSTCSGLDHYGFLFRSPEPNEGYLLGFTCDGSVGLRYWDGQQMETILDWNKTRHLLPGSDQTNRMLIHADGETISIFANGFLVAELDDKTSGRGRFGVLIGSEKTPNFQVEIEMISLWE